MRLALLVALLTLPQALVGLQVHTDFSLEWVVDSVQGTIQFEFNCTTDSWCAIGIGQGMSSANTILCTNAKCEEGSSTTYAAPAARSASSLTGVSFDTAGSATYTATWTRTLAAPTTSDEAFSSTGSTDIIWATGSSIGGINGHAMSTGRGITSVDTSTSSKLPPPPAATGTKTFHADFLMAWEVDSTSTSITVTYTCKKGSWCGMGIGKAMASASTIVCDDTTSQCNEGTTSGQAAPSNLHQDHLSSVSFDTTSSTTTYTATWTRTLAAPATGEAAFETVGETDIIWATGLGAPTGHMSKAATTVVFVAAANTPPGAPVTPVPTPVPLPASPVPTSPAPAPEASEMAWNSDFSMKWELEVGGGNSTILTVTYRCRDGQWCGLGFGSAMADADTVVCTETLCQSGHTSSFAAPTPDNPNQVPDFEIADDGDFYLATWKRDEGSQRRKRLNAAGATNVIWASASAGTPHGSVGSFAGAAEIDFASGAVKLLEEEDVDPLFFSLSVACLCLILVGGLAANRMLSRVRGLGYWIFVKNAGSALCLFMFALACGFFLGAFWDKDAWYHAFGPLAELLFCVVFTLPSGKGSIVWHTLRIPHERVIFFHRVLGSLIPFVIGIHGIGHYAANEWSSVLFSFETFGEVSPLPGFFVLIASILIIVPAIPALKAKSFEFFLFSHWLLVPTIVVFAILHTSHSILYFAPGLFMHALNGIFSEKRPFGIVVSEETTPGSTYAKFKIKVEGFKDAGPGAYGYLRVAGDKLQSHPFSVVDQQDNCVTLGIKNMGPGSSTEVIISRMFVGSAVRLNGPFGKPTVDVSEYAKIVLMGGGIGVTPLLGTAAWLAKHKKGSPHVHLHWAVREAALPRLFLQELVQLGASLGLQISLYYTGKEANAAELLGSLPSNIEVLRSRPDYGFILSQYTSTSQGAMNEALLASNGAAQVAVLLCGPAPMTDSIRDTITSKTWGNTRFDVHTEVFAL